MPTKKYYYAVGRRKQTTAVVRLYPKGKGSFTLVHNGKETVLKDFFGGNEYLYKRALSPLQLLGKDVSKGYDATITISGGWINGVADAVRLGFARALIVEDETKRTELKPFGLLARDPRIKERKKFGLKKARKKPKRSKR